MASQNKLGITLRSTVTIATVPYLITLKKELFFRIVPEDEYWCGVLYFTGSDEFNRQMRTIALEKGYTLNEYTLNKLGSKGSCLFFQTERFTRLKI